MRSSGSRRQHCRSRRRGGSSRHQRPGRLKRTPTSSGVTLFLFCETRGRWYGRCSTEGLPVDARGATQLDCHRVVDREAKRQAATTGVADVVGFPVRAEDVEVDRRRWRWRRRRQRTRQGGSWGEGCAYSKFLFGCGDGCGRFGPATGSWCPPAGVDCKSRSTQFSRVSCFTAAQAVAGGGRSPRAARLIVVVSRPPELVTIAGGPAGRSCAENELSGAG